MKKSSINVSISLQIIILLFLGINMYFTYMNKARLRATQRVMVETQERLSSTFTVMDDVLAQKIAKTSEAQPTVHLGPPVGKQAPAFVLPNEDGDLVGLSDYKGQETLLVFSQPGCQYCEEFYPILNDFKFQFEDINVVILQLDSTPEQNSIFKKQQNLTAPVLAATSRELSAYKIERTPTSVLLNEEGMVIGTQQVTSYEGLLQFIANSKRENQHG